MTTDLNEAQRFSFVRRPIAIPADLRINWRTSLVLMMLRSSRAKKASLAKLHVLNCAVRSEKAQLELEQMLSGGTLFSNWQLRVEPAFGRAIDFVVGRRLANWISMGQRVGLQLTASGIKSAEAIALQDSLLIEEKATVESIARKATERFVSDLLTVDRTA
jgi:hypothetical protein